MSDIADTIQDTADAPASVTVDGQTVVNRPVADLIAADRYAKASAGARTAQRGIRLTRLSLPKQCPADDSTTDPSLP